MSNSLKFNDLLFFYLLKIFCHAVYSDMVSLLHFLPDLPTSLAIQLHAFFLSLFRKQISKKTKINKKKKTTAKSAYIRTQKTHKNAG